MLILTRTTVYTLETGDGQTTPSVRYEGDVIRRVAEGVLCEIIGLPKGEIALLMGDETRHISTGIAEPIHSLLILDEDPLNLLIGTEPPHVYRLLTDGGTVQRIPSFDELEGRSQWYTPWGGPPALRSFASTEDGWVYADIHVGSIMRSPDWGESWEPVTPELHEDVHQVATCPQSNRRVYANTFRAVYISEDRGQSWLHRADDLGGRYGRAIVAHPEDPDCLLATVSDGPHGANVHGQLYRSEDAGRTWVHIGEGFPSATKENIDTFHVAFSSEGTAWAVVDRTLYIGRDHARQWEPFWEAPERILMISCRS